MKQRNYTYPSIAPLTLIKSEMWKVANIPQNYCKTRACTPHFIFKTAWERARTYCFAVYRMVCSFYLHWNFPSIPPRLMVSTYSTPSEWSVLILYRNLALIDHSKRLNAKLVHFTSQPLIWLGNGQRVQRSKWKNFAVALSHWVKWEKALHQTVACRGRNVPEHRYQSKIGGLAKQKVCAPYRGGETLLLCSVACAKTVRQVA